MTDAQRLTGIVVAPKRTFADVALRPSWLVPFLLLLLSNLAVNYVVFRVLVTDANFPQVARARIECDAAAAGPRKSNLTIEQQVEQIRGQRDHWYILPLLAVPLSVVALTIYFYLLLRLVRAGTSFVKTFAVLCWSFLIYRLLGGIVTIAALLARGPAKFFPGAPEAWSPTSLAHLISRSAVSPNAYSAVSKLDVFLLWWLVVLAIGLSEISERLPLRRAAILVAGSEVAYLLLNAAGLLPGAA